MRFEKRMMFDGVRYEGVPVLHEKRFVYENIAIAVIVGEAIQIALENVNVDIIVQFTLVYNDQIRLVIPNESPVALQCPFRNELSDFSRL